MPYSVKKSRKRRFYNWLLQSLNQLFVFLSIREKRKYWGVVYDSVTKLPLDPAIVKLVYADGGPTLTSITDLTGRYGFLARPGKFKILAKKTNYLFPSKIVSGNSDGIYKNLYHGEFFELHDDYEVVAPNIPMDQEAHDWNQKAKQNMIPGHLYLKHFFKKLVAVIFWFGLLAAIVCAALNFDSLMPVAVIVLFVYVMLIIANFVAPLPRLLGEVKLMASNPQAEKISLSLELLKPAVGGIVFGKTEVLPDGRFFLRCAPGDYMLGVKYKNEESVPVQIGLVSIKVGADGTVNDTILVHMV